MADIYSWLSQENHVFTTFFMQRNIFYVPSKHLLSLIFDTKFSELQQSAVLSVDSISQIAGGL